MSSITTEELAAAIRRHCLECSGGSIKGADRCKITHCALHPYRSQEAMGIKKAAPKLKGQIMLDDILKGVST